MSVTVVRPRRTLNQSRLYAAVSARLAALSDAERERAKRSLPEKQLRQLASGRLRDANAALTFAFFCGQQFESFVDGPPLEDTNVAETIERLECYLAENPGRSPRHSVLLAALEQLRRSR